MYACRKQRICPYCGPTSEDWDRLATEWLAWALETYGTTSSHELRSRGVPPNVTDTADLIETHPPRKERPGMTSTLAEMTAEIRTINTALGWREKTNTLGEYVALLHSEVAETLEAYRDHQLADATGPATPVVAAEEDYMGNYPHQGWRPGKPEGVGSEFADMVIRLLDTCDVHHISMPEVWTLADVKPVDPALIGAPHELTTFGDWMAWLHRATDLFWGAHDGVLLLRCIVTAADQFGLDLDPEIERKIAYNRTRPYKHGGRAL